MPRLGKVILPAPSADAGLPPGFRWRCLRIAALGVLGVTAVCCSTCLVAAVLALPLLLVGVPVLLACEAIFFVCYWHKVSAATSS